MKKVFLAIAATLMSVAGMAQNTTPNRMLVHKGAWDYKAYAIDRVDSISFTTVEGTVKATIDYQGFSTGDTGDTIRLGVQKSDQCYYYYIDVLPTNTVSQYSDEVLASYFERSGSAQPFYDNFDRAVMTGFETPFQSNTSYTIFTVAYDSYGVACEASRAEFTTPATPLVGNPTVEWTLNQATTTSLTLTFTPSSDTDGYAYCLFNKGEAESQFEMWGPMFGFSNMGDMIKQFCQSTITGKTTNTWTDLNPDTEYEIYVQPWDVNGTYADMVIADVSTAKQGGEGVAQVSIQVMEFGGDATNGYWQRVVNTPNDQTALFRDVIVDVAKFNDGVWSDEKAVETLQTEYPDDPYWNQYKTDDVKWNAEPSTTYYAIAMAQNINGEWGPLSKVQFTTPASAGQPTVSNAPAVSKRIVDNRTSQKATYAPRLKAKKGIKLTIVK